MSRVFNSENFPYFPPSPPYHFPAPPHPPVTSPPPPKFPIPPPHHPPNPPSPTVKPPSYPIPPPPPHHAPNPPSPTTKPPSYPIPPPPHPFSPPQPPHILPPPPSPSPPTPGHHSTIIIFILVPIGGLFFLAFLAAALFCFAKKRKKTIVQEIDKLKIDEHFKVQEDIVPGPHGSKTVILTIDEDVHIEEEIKKNVSVGETSTARSKINNSQALDVVETSTKSNIHHCKF